MNIPVILASESTTNSPAEVVTFNKWWIERLVIGSQNGQNPGANVSLVKFGVDSEGKMVLSDERFNLRIPNVMQEAAENESLGAAFAAIINYVGQKAVESGKASSIVATPSE